MSQDDEINMSPHLIVCPPSTKLRHLQTTITMQVKRIGTNERELKTKRKNIYRIHALDNKIKEELDVI